MTFPPPGSGAEVVCYNMSLVQSVQYSDMGAQQRVWNRREIQLTRPALPYDYTCFADGTLLKKEIFVWYKYRVYNNLLIINISYSNEVPSAKHV